MANWHVQLVCEDGSVACASCSVADGWVSRARGLLGRTALAASEGLLIRHTRAVHTHFMRFPIDVVFVDRDGVVLRIWRSLRPWRAVSCRRAHAVVELPAGACERIGLRVGDRLAEQQAPADSQ